MDAAGLRDGHAERTVLGGAAGAMATFRGFMHVDKK